MSSELWSRDIEFVVDVGVVVGSERVLGTTRPRQAATTFRALLRGEAVLFRKCASTPCSSDSLDGERVEKCP